MNVRRINQYLLTLFLVIFSAPFASPQTGTSATVVGLVTDATGAIVSSATVTIKQSNTNTILTTTTNESGQYRFPFLKPTEYTISAEATGLQASVSRFNLLVGEERSVNLVLAVGSLSQSVEVNAAGEILQTENANRVTSYSEKEVANQPVNGGDITNIAFSTAGLRLNVGGGNNNFNVNGLPFSSVLFTMNGADIVEPYNLNNKSGSSNNTLGANDVAEAAVIVNAYSAQYGRMAGAQVNYVSKSGANQVHGNLVENYNDAILNSNDYFKTQNGTPRGKAVANQYAASIGGPIYRDKVFFYANTEGLRYALPSSGTVSLPSTQLQQYVLTHVPASSVPLYQSLFSLYNAAPGITRAVAVTTGNGSLQDTTGNLGCGKQTFSGTYVNGTSGPQFGRPSATNTANPVGVPCAVAFGTNVSQINTEALISGRIDYNLSDKQKIYIRVSRDAGTQAGTTSPISSVFNTQSIQPWVIPQLNYTYAITPSLVNNFVASGNWYSAIFGVSNFQQAQSLLPAVFSFSDGGANGGGFAGLGPALPNGRRGQQLEIIDDLSWSRGHHTLQAGINDRNNRITDSSITSGSVTGTYAFSDLTDFTVGTVNSTGKGSKFTQSFPLLSAAHTRINSLDFYIQDEWSTSRKLKITYGIRFEEQGNPSCKENCFSRTNAEFLSANYQAGASVPYNATLKTGLNKTFTHLEGIVYEPRLGIAFSPFGKGSTVIRGGVGLFANTFAGSLAANIFNNAPNKFSPTVSSGIVGLASAANSSQTAAIASNTAFQQGFSSGATLSQLQNAVKPATFATPTLYTNPDNFATIKALEWSAEIEQPLGKNDVLSITYSGNHGYDQPLTNTDANGYVGVPNRYPNGFRGLPNSIPDPRFATVSQILISGYSNYNGLTAQVRHAFHYGFQGQANYTWSKSLQLGTVYDPSNLHLGYAPTSFDTRHNLTAYFLWTSPKQNHFLLNSFLGGWTIGGKLYLYSGRPFAVTNSLVTTNLAPASGSNTVGGMILADVIDRTAIGRSCSKAAIGTPCLTTTQFAGATGPNQQADFGNTPPNSFRGPGYFSIASQVTKRIPVHERYAFEIGASAYNLTNHTNLAVPASNVGASGFGLISSTVSSPTSIYGAGQGAIVSGRVIVVLGKFVF
jgi:hypothetical protein